MAGDGGAKNAYVAGYRVAAKTGTSEKIGDDRNARIASCVAFAPADDPKIAVIIVVDEPTDGIKYGSVVAAPYVANVLEAVLPYLGVEPVYTEEELENLTVKVPTLTGLSASDACSLLEGLGIAAECRGEGHVVSAQIPAAGSVILQGGAKVVLTVGSDTGSGEVTVPSLVGVSAAEANRLLRACGLNITVCGAKDYYKVDKTVTAQSPAAGTVLPPGESVSIYFSYDAVKE